MNKCLLLAATALASIACHAQSEWTYTQCLDYAREHNISLQQSQLQEQSADYTLEASKAQWLPSLSFSTSQNYGNTPFIDEGNKNVYNGSYGLNAQWTLYNGGQRENTIKRDELNTQISALSTESIFRSLETQILSLYINILYAKENIGICQDAAAVSLAQAERAKALMESGRISRVDYAQLNAQAEQDKYSVVNATATYDNQRMQLKKLLQLGLTQQIDVVTVDFPESAVLAPQPPIEESYQMALLTDVELQSNKLSLESAELEEKIAGASGKPQISVNAGVGTGAGAPGSSLWNQLKWQWNETVGLSVNVPIFDQKQTKTAVAKAKIQKMSADLDIEDRKNEIEQLIEELYISLSNNQAKYQAGITQVESAALSAELTNLQFENGLVNPVELLQAHNNELQARSELLQAKYMVLLDKKMLEYYRTATVTLN